MLDTTVLSSTFLLTVLLGIGLIFFIKASTKERSTELNLVAEGSEESVLPKLEQYFSSRAYKIDRLDPQSQSVTFKGMVRPSWFLAIFLSSLAASGLACLGLVLGFIYPSIGNWFLVLVLFSPVAGWFYWRGAGRMEYVSIQVEPVLNSTGQTQTLIKVIGHRDELAILQQSLQLKAAN